MSYSNRFHCKGSPLDSLLFCWKFRAVRQPEGSSPSSQSPPFDHSLISSSSSVCLTSHNLFLQYIFFHLWLVGLPSGNISPVYFRLIKSETHVACSGITRREHSSVRFGLIKCERHGVYFWLIGKQKMLFKRWTQLIMLLRIFVMYRSCIKMIKLRIHERSSTCSMCGRNDNACDKNFDQKISSRAWKYILNCTDLECCSVVWFLVSIAMNIKCP